ncbi:fasciclin domain-containing protein [Sphingobacterium sp. MYb382]|uniref:fasciclin domain-containing protein n=1 Tax=Sphingobacterium sp. MYb382 TaxID=2745278 RepID=UPI0030B25FD9
MRQYVKHYKLYAVLFVGVLTVSCDKAESTVVAYDSNRLNMVIADNFNLSLLSASLRVSGLDKELQSNDGPITVLAPSDAAFGKAGYNNTVSILSERPSVVSQLVKYHLMDGKYELNKLPFLFNQEIRTRGGKVFATRWAKGADTVLTLNGARVVATNIPASNGIIQVLDRVLTPYQHDKIMDAIVAQPNITLFAQALQRSGLAQTLAENGPYTVFAPSNMAMEALGYRTVQQIEGIAVEELKRLVDYHIVRDRRFIYDYILSTGPSNVSRQAMLDGNSVAITLKKATGSTSLFDGITLKGLGNTTAVSVIKQDILTGNGVLHIVDQALRITQ